MSNHLIKRAYLLAASLPATAVAMCLADHLNDDTDLCCPSIETMARELHCHRATIIRALAELESIGAIRRHGTGGRHNRYELTFSSDQLRTATSSSQQPVAQSDRSTRRTEQLGPVAHSYPKPKIKTNSLNQELRHAPQNRGTRLAPDWRPTDDDIAWTETHRRDLDVDAVAGSFADYWHALPGSRGVKLDWHATWRNWCRREPRRVGGPAHPSAIERVEAAIRERRGLA